jgi:predicted nuclease with RNAse H fold
VVARRQSSQFRCHLLMQQTRSSLSIMLVAGVDFASQESKTAVCVLEWSEGRARLENLAVGASDHEILKVIENLEKVGIDVPLGWPMAFAKAIFENSQSGTWPSGYRHSENEPFRFRQTDLWVWREVTKRPPLSVSADRIALPAMRAAAILSTMQVRPPRDGSGLVVEVYPAAALHRWGLTSSGYKGPEKIHVRKTLLDHLLEETASWLSIPSDAVDAFVTNDDAFDALIAAIVALMAGLGQTEPIPMEHQASSLREGWIAIPRMDSLACLTKP